MRMTKVLALLVGAAACGGGEEPTVEIVSSAPAALVTADDTQDDLTLRVRYEDPTGDLGGGLARVHDCRSANVTTELRIPPIANERGVDEQIAISGELELLVTDIGTAPSGGPSEVCRDAGAEAGAFCVVLVDAAGNESDAACTEVLAIE
jgi:hypothetical protein